MGMRLLCYGSYCWNAQLWKAVFITKRPVAPKSCWQHLKFQYRAIKAIPYGSESSWPSSGSGQKTSRPVRLADLNKKPREDVPDNKKPPYRKPKESKQTESQNDIGRGTSPEIEVSTDTFKKSSKAGRALPGNDDRDAVTQGSKKDVHRTFDVCKTDDPSTISAEELERRQTEKAKNLGRWYFSKWNMSGSKLKERILDKGYSLEAAEKAVQELTNEGVVADISYARDIANHKWINFKWSPNKIKQELKRLGIGGQEIEIALASVFEAESSGLDVRSEIKKDVANFGEHMQGFDYQLLATLKRRQANMNGLPATTQKRRLAAWLQRRGYAWFDISKLLKSLNL